MNNKQSNNTEYIAKCVPCSFETVVDNKPFPLLCNKCRIDHPCVLYRADYLFNEENLGHLVPASYGEWDKLDEDMVKRMLTGFFELFMKQK